MTLKVEQNPTKLWHGMTREDTARHEKTQQGTRRHDKAREGTGRHKKAWGMRAQNVSYSPYLHSCEQGSQDKFSVVRNVNIVWFSLSWRR